MEITVYVYEGLATGITYINADFRGGDYRAMDWVDMMDFIHARGFEKVKVVALDGGYRG